MPIYRNCTNHFAYVIRDDVREYKYEERTTRFDRITVSILDVYHVDSNRDYWHYDPTKQTQKKKKKKKIDRF